MCGGGEPAHAGDPDLPAPLRRCGRARRRRRLRVRGDDRGGPAISVRREDRGAPIASPWRAKAITYKRLAKLDIYDYYLALLIVISLLPAAERLDARVLLTLAIFLLSEVLVVMACVSFDDVTGFRDGSDAFNYGPDSPARKPLLDGTLSEAEALRFAWLGVVRGRRRDARHPACRAAPAVVGDRADRDLSTDELSPPSGTSTRARSTWICSGADALTQPI